MRLNYFAYYYTYDGYGRYNARLVKALLDSGVDVKVATMEHIPMPAWMHKREGICWDALSISSMPPYYLQPVPGRHWLLTMTEGSLVPPKWVEKINTSGVERVIVPCQHNKLAFEASGVTAPVSVVPGGTDPEEFLLLSSERPPAKPYTFLALADRGSRKGWEEVYNAFYVAFGGKTSGCKDVRLIIKERPPANGKSVLRMMANAQGMDARIVCQTTDMPDMREVYAQADCVAIPSRSEGWGMPQREAAMMGLPVITQQYSGLDDGHTQEWALTTEPGELRPVPKKDDKAAGEWMVADVASLADRMRWCYENPALAQEFGYKAAQWLRANQTWQHAADKLLALIGAQDGVPV
jgi:glycosyltransferase involved in cell wall biosynthesis